MTNTHIEKLNITSLPETFLVPLGTTTLTSNTLYSFCLFCTLYKWNPTVHALFRLAPLLKCLRDSSMMLHVAADSSVVERSIVWIHPTVFVHSTAKGCWVIFSFVAIKNSAAVNAPVHAFSLQPFVSHKI